MKRTKTKWLHIAASTALLFAGLLTACSNSKETASDPAREKVDFSEHETFTVWQRPLANDYYATDSDNPAIQYINRKFNITLTYEQPAAGTESDSLSLMFGTGEYTDMVDMTLYTGSLSELYDDGVIIDIAEYLDYMPNFKKLLDSDKGFSKACYNDEGKILTLRILETEDPFMWGGLVYRRDILETMTGGNIAFPSGNAEPTTIADWEYMLPLFKTYFETAGMKNYAPLIIPSNGYFGLSELVNGFGSGSNYYVEDNKVKFGPLENGFYNYVKKMNEWYAAGYIYKDFASRTNDPFYLPNTSLTYGGAAGVWYGLNSQLGGAMSMPEYGLIFDVQPVKNPIDAANGVTEAAPFARTPYNQVDSKGSAITKACKNIPKLLSVLDWLYSDEGSMLYNGLTKEQGADTDPVYVKAGLQDGAYWFEGDKLVFNPMFSRAGGKLNHEPFMPNQLPGLWNNSYENAIASPEYQNAHDVWGAYGGAKQTRLPSAISRPTSEDKIYANNTFAINDYIGSSVPKFIMGTTPLNDKTWADFKAQLVALGIYENLRILQEAYNRYMAR
jgi:hypothetical protein